MAQRIKITILNKTQWQTRMLRPFIARIAREEFPGTNYKNTRRKLLVRIVYRRGRGKSSTYCTGCAHLNSSTATIRVPNPKYCKEFPVRDFVHVIGHEFGHCRGLTHAQMGLQHGGSYTRGSYSWPHYEPWASALPVPLPTVRKTVSVTERRSDKLARAQAAVKTWTRKSKLAATKLKYWTRRVRALEKLQDNVLAIAACTSPTGGEA